MLTADKILPQSVSMKILLSVLLLLLILVAWFWLNYNDYFNTSYRDLTGQEQKQFEWRDNYSPSGIELKEAYRARFNRKEFEYPRQKVKKIRLYKNNLLFGIFTGKTLNQQQIDYFLQYCNDPSNFDWSETTWSIWDAEYFFKLYDETGKVIGKIYFCLLGCRQVEARPFSPRMKFGGLSERGLKDIHDLINEIGS
jgi:hypothetical protein